MNLEIGQTALLTLDHWFYAPDGRQYRAVFGRVNAVRSAEETLGIKTNAKSTNWYVEIGCMTVAGCQIHYAVRCEFCELGPVHEPISEEGSKSPDGHRKSHIFHAGWSS